MTTNISSREASGGISFFGLLTVLFIGLKLTGYIDWSWWLVLSPLWGPWAVILTFILILGFIAGIIILLTAIAEWATMERR